MKKMKYIQPKTTVLLVKTNRHMLAGSNQFSGNGSSVTLNPETMSSGDGGDAASRINLWDWDDEEE